MEALSTKQTQIKHATTRNVATTPQAAITTS